MIFFAAHCPATLPPQVIVEKAERSDIPDIDKKKYLVGPWRFGSLGRAAAAGRASGSPAMPARPFPPFSGLAARAGQAGEQLPPPLLLPPSLLLK